MKSEYSQLHAGNDADVGHVFFEIRMQFLWDVKIRK